jgi:hypothetical protein
MWNHTVIQHNQRTTAESERVATSGRDEAVRCHQHSHDDQLGSQLRTDNLIYRYHHLHTHCLIYTRLVAQIMSLTIASQNLSGVGPVKQIQHLELS